MIEMIVCLFYLFVLFCIGTPLAVLLLWVAEKICDYQERIGNNRKRKKSTGVTPTSTDDDGSIWRKGDPK